MELNMQSEKTTRLGRVFWWLGALLGAVAGVAWVSTALTENVWLVFAGPLVFIGLAAPFWAIAYVLSGSFWRPPAEP
jgi:hypothetical protein